MDIYPLYLMKSATGDSITITSEAIIVELSGKRDVVSSAAHNGGSRSDLTHLYNYTYSQSPFVKQKIVAKMECPNLQTHYARLTQELGLPVDTTASMGTAALLEDAALLHSSFAEIHLSTIVTAGVDHNAARAGDPPSYDEFTGENLPTPGTINIMLFIDAHLPAGTATQAIITATEAKSAALQELQAGSLYSNGIATGSGTDTIMVITRPDAPDILYDAGHHSRLGSAIGQLVKKAVKQALAHHPNGMTPTRQATLLWQGFRYRITRDTISSKYQELFSKVPDSEKIEQILIDPEVFAYTAPLLHLQDQYAWGMLRERQYNNVYSQCLHTFCQVYQLPITDNLLSALAHLIHQS